MADVVITEQDGHVVHFRINRPESRNSISQELMKRLSDAFREADADSEIRVVVLSGVGEHFGAGYDLNVDWRNLYGNKNPLGARRMLSECVEFEMSPWRCSKPVIAMIRGFCLAGSCELAMMCCISYASETAKLGEPEIRFSATPPAIVMPWVTGLRHARELLYSGDVIDAYEAQRIGLVNRVFPDGDLDKETMRYAHRVATVDPEAVQMMKACMNFTAENAGFEQCLKFGIENGALVDVMETKSYRQFMEVAQRDGLRAAIRWRDSQFN